MSKIIIVPATTFQKSAEAYAARLRRFEESVEEAALALHRRKEDWLGLISGRVLPGAIVRSIDKYGTGIPQCVRGWIARHVRVDQHPGGKLEYVLDGNVVATAVFALKIKV